MNHDSRVNAALFTVAALVLVFELWMIWRIGTFVFALYHLIVS